MSAINPASFVTPTACTDWLVTVHRAGDVNLAWVCPNHRLRHMMILQMVLKATYLPKAAASETHTSTPTSPQAQVSSTRSQIWLVTSQ